jgi:dUTP pyrophosphatase
VQIKIVNTSHHALPKYETIGAAGMDIRAFLNAPITLTAHSTMLIPTGLYIELPKGYEAQLRARSGLALKQSIILPNAPATIDSDYRGEINVILHNLSPNDFEIKDGDRIAQMVISKHETIDWHLVEELTSSDRAGGGFGHTGTQ